MVTAGLKCGNNQGYGGVVLLRLRDTILKVAFLIPDGFIGIFD
jgi:hypothetical protein